MLSLPIESMLPGQSSSCKSLELGLLYACSLPIVMPLMSAHASRTLRPSSWRTAKERRSRAKGPRNRLSRIFSSALPNQFVAAANVRAMRHVFGCLLTWVFSQIRGVVAHSLLACGVLCQSSSCATETVRPRSKLYSICGARCGPH